jgi:hypothetical protein
VDPVVGLPRGFRRSLVIHLFPVPGRPQPPRLQAGRTSLQTWRKDAT